MTDLQTTKAELSFKNEAIQQQSESVVQGIDTIKFDDPIPLHKMGREIVSWSIPGYEIESTPYYLPAASVEANEHRVIIKTLIYGFTGGLTHLLPFYYILGKVTEAAGVFTFTAHAPIDNKPHLTARNRYLSKSTLEKIQHLTGTKMITQTFTFDFINSKLPMISMMYMGDTMQDPTDATIKEGGTDMDPTLPGTDILIRHPLISNFFENNVGGTEVNILTNMAFFALQTDDIVLLLGPEVGQLTINEVADGELVHMVKITTIRGSTWELTNYVNTFTNSTTKADYRIKFGSDSVPTKYIDLIFTGLTPASGVIQKQNEKGMEFDEYTFTFKNISGTGKDGLNKTNFYGIAP